MLNGITEYTEGKAVFPVFFPKGKEDCRHCGFCYYVEAFAVYKCRLTDSYIEKVDINRRHSGCPIILQEE